MLSVGGKPSGRVRETVTRQIQAAETVVSGQPSLLQLKLPGASSLTQKLENLLTLSIQHNFGVYRG